MFRKKNQSISNCTHRPTRCGFNSVLKVRTNGYCFISAIKVLGRSQPHVIDGKQVDCKTARRQPKPDFLKVKKLFVGGLSNSTTESALKKHFSTFGTVSIERDCSDIDTIVKKAVFDLSINFGLWWNCTQNQN